MASGQDFSRSLGYGDVWSESDDDDDGGGSAAQRAEQAREVSEMLGVVPPMAEPMAEPMVEPMASGGTPPSSRRPTAAVAAAAARMGGLCGEELTMMTSIPCPHLPADAFSLHRFYSAPSGGQAVAEEPQLVRCWSAVPPPFDPYAALATSPVALLPEELLRAVLLRAGPADLLKSVRQTCVLFRGWLDRDGFWAEVCRWHGWADRHGGGRAAPPGPGSLWPTAAAAAAAGPARMAGRWAAGPWERCAARWVLCWGRAEGLYRGVVDQPSVCEWDGLDDEEVAVLCNELLCFPGFSFPGSQAADPPAPKQQRVQPAHQPELFELLGGPAHAAKCVNPALCGICGLANPLAPHPGEPEPEVPEPAEELGLEVPELEGTLEQWRRRVGAAPEGLQCWFRLCNGFRVDKLRLPEEILAVAALAGVR